MSATVAVPLPSATVMLLRDGADGLEVFMVVRHHQIDFASGALVFPGGKVDPGDSAVAVRGRCRGVDALGEAELAYRVCAIREAFEECGVLLARPQGQEELVGAERLATLDRKYRHDLEKGVIGIGRMTEQEDLELACDLLVPFAHWITPTPMPKRFDTHFFLANAPADQLAVHDGRESVDSVWITPRQALADADAGRLTLVFATSMNLKKLANSDSVAAATAAAQGAAIVTVMPQVSESPDGRVLRIPLAAGYGVAEVSLKGMPRP